MVPQSDTEGGEILELRRPQLEVTQRTMARLEELARLMETSIDVANQMAVANTLHTVQQGLAIYPRPLLEPGPDHNRGLDGV